MNYRHSKHADVKAFYQAMWERKVRKVCLLLENWPKDTATEFISGVIHRLTLGGGYFRLEAVHPELGRIIYDGGLRPYPEEQLLTVLHPT